MKISTILDHIEGRVYTSREGGTVYTRGGKRRRAADQALCSGFGVSGPADRLAKSRGFGLAGPADRADRLGFGHKVGHFALRPARDLGDLVDAHPADPVRYPHRGEQLGIDRLGYPRQTGHRLGGGGAGHGTKPNGGPAPRGRVVMGSS